MSIHEAFPYLRASNAKQAIAFYKDLFGVTEKFRLEGPNGRIGHSIEKVTVDQMQDRYSEETPNA